MNREKHSQLIKMSFNLKVFQRNVLSRIYNFISLHTQTIFKRY